MNLTKEEKQVLLHSLGLSDLSWYDKDQLSTGPIRNYFYTSKDSADYPFIKSLIKKDLMINSNKGWDKGSSYFFATPAGIILAIGLSEKQMQKNMPTRSQRRYNLYRRSESEESFIEWLKNSYWNDYRKRHGC